MRVLAFSLLALAGGCLYAQAPACACGASPPPPAPSRTLAPYANTPEDLRPFSKFTQPYYENYTRSPEYNGAARDVPDGDAARLQTIDIGFLGPIENHPDQVRGLAMLHGAQLVVAEANARGGYCGKPFRLRIHNDAATWGASSNEIVKMIYDEKVWAMMGSLGGDSTHIALRVSLRAELPIVNSAATDPTIPETEVPWILTAIQDDRVQGYTLARRIYTDLGLKRIAILRVNDRYGRFGVLKFRDASRRLGHPVVIEQKFEIPETTFTRQLRVINDSDVDGIVVWADAAAAATILQEMHAMGMRQPVFGGARVFGPDLFRLAGPAAEGLEFVYPFDPTRDDPAWLDFGRRYDAAYHTDVNLFSALSYDGMNILLQAICRAGLNRGRIRDALYSLESYRGVTGEMSFDPNAKNITPLFLGKIKDGRASFRRYPIRQPYAAIGQNVGYAGPPVADAAGPQLAIAVFGPGAEKLAASLRAPGYNVEGISSDVSWGKASTALVKMVYDPSVLGIVATDRASAHLAEQIAVKTFLPVIALSNDRALTSANIPWIFRLPMGTPPAEAVRCLAAAARRAGPNRGRIRDLLASGARLENFSFQGGGEPR